MKVSVAIVLFSALVFGQTFQGNLRGHISDPSAGNVASARVTITDQATQTTRATITNEQGDYVFTAIDPATYTVTAEAPGFKKITRSGVEIDTGQG